MTERETEMRLPSVQNNYIHCNMQNHSNLFPELMIGENFDYQQLQTPRIKNIKVAKNIEPKRDKSTAKVR